MLARPQREAVALLATKEHRIKRGVEHFDAQLPLLIDDFHMLPRYAVIPGSGPDACLAADGLSHAGLQFSPPALVRLRPLSDEIRHQQKSEDPKNQRTKEPKNAGKWTLVLEFRFF